jgi:Holliday junction resolvase RusA-like endonuclease
VTSPHSFTNTKTAAAAASSKQPSAASSRSLRGDFWVDDSDELVAGSSFFRVTIHGKPVPQPRYRTGRGGTYDPSEKHKKALRRLLLKKISKKYTGQVPIFGSERVGIKMVFRLRRPNSHFVGGKRQGCAYKPEAPDAYPTSRPDIDNLEKFILDVLNGIGYIDDGQVVFNCTTKILDNTGDCQGATTISLFPVTEESLKSMCEVHPQL